METYSRGGGEKKEKICSARILTKTSDSANMFASQDVIGTAAGS